MRRHRGYTSFLAEGCVPITDIICCDKTADVTVINKQTGQRHVPINQPVAQTVNHTELPGLTATTPKFHPDAVEEQCITVTNISEFMQLKVNPCFSLAAKNVV